MNTLTIKNFGPIKDVTLNIKKVNLLIGTQGSGKSTIAKILSIMNDPTLVLANSVDSFLVDYNIDFELIESTLIEYRTPLVNITIRGKHLEHGLLETISESSVDNFEESLLKVSENDTSKFMTTLLNLTMGMPLSEAISDNIFSTIDVFGNKNAALQKEQRRYLIKLLFTSIQWEKMFETCVYIPAERNIVSLIADNFFALGDSLGLPKCIRQFGVNYERARKSYESIFFMEIPFINGLHYRRKNKKDEIMYQEVTSTLAQGSSGFQSSVPLAVVCSKNRNTNKSLFIIEEPEQNLYPVTQYDLVKFIADNCLQNDNKLLVTTHSPYILTSFVNLIQAHASGAVKPRVTAKLIPKLQWIDFNDVSAYFIDEGTSKDILDYEEKTIFAEAIDNASADIANEYSGLLDIAYTKK